MSEQGSLLGFLSDPRLAPYATERHPGMAVERGRDPHPLGQSGGRRDLQRGIVRRADRPHHRSQRLGRAADRAARRHAAAWRGAAARAAARFRRTHGRRADVRLLADLAGRPHARHSGGRDRSRRAQSFADRQGAASARRLRRAACAVCRRRLAAACDAGGASPAWPRRQASPRSAPPRSAPRRWLRAAPKASTAPARFRSSGSAPIHRRLCWSTLRGRDEVSRGRRAAARAFRQKCSARTTGQTASAGKGRRTSGPAGSSAVRPPAIPDAPNEPRHRHAASSRSRRRRAAAERRQPLRFVWQMDDDSRFTLGSDEFKALIGPQTAAALGQPWSEIAATLGLDPEGQVARAFASRDTWSGITVAFPVDGSRHAARRRTVRTAGVRPRPQLPRLSRLRRLPRRRAHQRTDAHATRRLARRPARRAAGVPRRAPGAAPCRRR